VSGQESPGPRIAIPELQQFDPSLIACLRRLELAKELLNRWLSLRCCARYTRIEAHGEQSCCH
jgi:hypothetical protein